MNISSQDILRSVFEYNTFRNGQDEIIDSIVSGNDTLVVMPTAGGKSLCYQIPALMKEGTAVVISPLIALMKDQVDALNRKKYPASFINSSISFQEIDERIRLAQSGRIKLLYLAPERLESRKFLQSLSGINISFLAVDEAHCISEWGHDFRPSYQRIKDIFTFVERVPIIALTATATVDVQEDIIQTLELKKPHKYIRGFDRPNLNYITINTDDKLNITYDKLRKSSQGSSIIYCGTRKKVETIMNQLKGKGIKLFRYHGGLSELERKQEQDRFINSESGIIVATNAFGMGIDKPNVRNVIHLDYTATLEGYYQEAGRAGRDGESSDCMLLYSPADYGLQDFFIRTMYPEKSDIEKTYNTLYDLCPGSVGLDRSGSIYLSALEIANRAGLSEAKVQSILKLFEKNKLLIKGVVSGSAKIKITQDMDFVYDYYETLPLIQREVLEVLLRNVSREAFRNIIDFDISSVIRKTSVSADEFYRILQLFENSGLVKIFMPSVAKGITLLYERMPTDSIPIDFEKLNRRRELAYRKLNVLMKYAETMQCKRNYILEYFGEIPQDGDCGRCSACKSDKKEAAHTAKEIYLIKSVVNAINETRESFGKNIICDYLLGTNKSKLTSKRIVFKESFGCAKESHRSEILNSINAAISLKYVEQTSGLYPILKLTPTARILFRREKSINKTSYDTGSLNSDMVYRKLKELRQYLAANLLIQPRGIVSDNTLRLISKIQPKSIAELAELRGVSKVFVDSFGDKFINQIKQLERADTNSTKNNRIELNKIQKILVVGLNRKLSLSELAVSVNSKPATTAQFIQEMMDIGLTPDVTYLFDLREYAQIKQYLQYQPRAYLKDIKANGYYKSTLPEMRLMIACAKKELNHK